MSVSGNGKKSLLAVMVVVAMLGTAAMWLVREAEPPIMETSPSEYRPERFRDKSKLKDSYLEVYAVMPEAGPLRAITVNSFGAICTGGDESLVLLRSDGTVVGRRKIDTPVTCLAFSPHGDIYAGHKDHVAIYDDSLEIIDEWKAFDKKSFLSSIVVFRKEVFVADSGLRTILRYYNDGTFHTRIGDRDDDRKIPGLIAPSPCIDLARAGNSRMFVTNPGRHKISTYNFRGDLLASFGNAGMHPEEFSGCCNPAAIASLPDGSIVAVEKHIVRLKRYDRRGRFIGIIADTDQFDQKTKLFDLAADSKGRIFFLESGNDRIRVFENKSSNSRSVSHNVLG